MPMAVNFSRTTLAFPEVADRLEEIRQKFDIPAELLQVEITETASTEDYRTFQKVVDSIRAKGFRVAIDDFGVAYANLMTLARLGFDPLGHPARRGVDRELSRNIERTAGLDGLRIGTHGLGRMGRSDDGFHKKLS